MNNTFTFRFKGAGLPGKAKLVVFCENDISPDSISENIKSDTSKNLLPASVYILSTHLNKKNLTKAAENNSFIKELKGILGDDVEIHFGISTPKGKIIPISEDEAPLLSDEIIKAGALEIFEKRKGLISSSPQYHFKKPSGAHCDKFIRVSNLLTSSAEVTFLSLGILPYITKNIRRVYVDTSSISYLISRALQLSGEEKGTLINIDSFESYAAFEQNLDFIEGNDSLMIISATTSGSLVKRIIKEKNFEKRNIITLFHHSLPPDQLGIHSLDEIIQDGIYSAPANECNLCNKDNSRVIHIVGEQFLPETPKHEQFLIRKPHFLKSREKFFSEFATRELLKFDFKLLKDRETEHFYFDMEKLCLNIDSFSDFKNDLYSELNRHFSVDIKTVIFFGDNGSLQLKEKVISYLSEKKITSINFIDYESVDENEFPKNSSVMVISGSITSGRNLLFASRKLRILSSSASIKYLVGLSKLPTKEDFDLLDKNLTQGGHTLITLRKCELPRIKERIKTSWTVEKNFLDKFNDPFNDEQEDLPQILKSRLDDDVNQNNLFLKKANGDTLKLRGTFAFWSDLDELICSNASQSDVYWTMQSIFHDQRNHNNQKGLASIYHFTVISPVCFDRFNDGVIQACILRSASPSELNYSINEEYSRQMTDILTSIISNWDNDQGEACLEFLMSMCSGRLKLTPSHTAEITELKSDSMTEDMKFLLEKLEQKNKKHSTTQ